MPAWLGKGLLLGSRILILSLHGGRSRRALDGGFSFIRMLISFIRFCTLMT